MGKIREYNDNVFLQPFVEGAWMTKHNGKYYMQYGAPATEFSGYSDGVYVSKSPLEGFSISSTTLFPISREVLPEGQGTEPLLKTITKTGGMFQPFLFPLKIILKEGWESGLQALIKMM